MASIAKQRGITLIGFVFVLIFIGLPLWAAFQLVPVYYEYLGVVLALKSLENEAVKAWTPSKIKDFLWRRFEVNGVEDISMEDVYIDRGDGVWIVGVNYEVERPYIGNIYLLVRFQTEVELPR